jgi:hypothetical protein
MGVKYPVAWFESKGDHVKTSMEGVKMTKPEPPPSDFNCPADRIYWVTDKEHPDGGYWECRDCGSRSDD